MMTRREKLLIRPWQLRRYNNHKKKIVNASPIVDFGPPPQRTHVTVKLKKLQKEKERQMKIEEDNFKLLQKLGSIMREKRVDNCWETQPPTFLRRVSIYHRTRTPSACEETTPESTPEVSTTRRSKCVACTPQPKSPPIIPEERIPWEPPKKILTRRMSSSAVVPVTSDFDFLQINKKQGREVKRLVQTVKKMELPSIGKSLLKVDGAEQRIVVSQGPVQIAVNVPAFAQVKILRGRKEKYLQRSLCCCRSFRQNKAKLTN